MPRARTRSKKDAPEPPDPRELVEEAKKLLAGHVSASAEGLAALAKKLEGADRFHYARRVYEKALEQIPAGEQPPLRWVQKQAVCTYKDPDLPLHERLRDALKLLTGIAASGDAEEQAETQALMGAVYKRRFLHDGRREHLERALAHYSAPVDAAEDVMVRDGYPAINAAFVGDQLAWLEYLDSGDGELPKPAQDLLSKSKKLREELVGGIKKRLEKEAKPDPWLRPTLFEAYFGLERFAEAREQLTELSGELRAQWQQETTARQLASLARIQSDLRQWPAHPSHKERANLDREAWATVEAIVQGNAAAIESTRLGRVGLALSGGGFRASLFHLGVLARLAELDVLRHIEVISCVSGGAIVGAHYYLALRRRLEACPDETMNREAYVEIVQATIWSFLRGVQKNLRMQVFASPRHNWRMLTEPGYSRTSRLAELYEEMLFAELNREPLVPGAKGDAAGAGLRPPIPLRSLRVKPAGADEGFHPRSQNWKRAAKVPVLVLNATSMNTGHNWQFTASWMGEPPSSIRREVDGNFRLRRMYFDQIKGRPLHDLSLGTAVAASSCVPILFEPVELEGLYPDKIVQLVDGGVHDNQGVASLLEQNCDVILASDASGQSDSAERPSKEALSVNQNVTGNLMARVRLAQYQELHTLQQSEVVKALTFLHLKRDLPVIPIDWTPCDDPKEQRERAAQADRQEGKTDYGVGLELQEALAAVRTDLDGFSDAEAYALMASGYLMARKLFREFRPQPPPEKTADWPFERAVEIAGQPGTPDYENLLAHVKVGRAQFFKALHQPGRAHSRSRTWMSGIALLVLLLVAPSWVGAAAGWLAWLAAWYVGLAGLLYVALRMTGRRKSFVQVALGLGMTTFGWWLVRQSLRRLDPQFLEQGRLPPAASSRPEA